MIVFNTVLRVPKQVYSPARLGRAAWVSRLRRWLGSAAVLLGCSMLLGVAQAQTQTLEPGTVVTLLPPDLVGVYATAVVGGDRRLIFDNSLDPETEVRVLIMPPGADAAPSPPYGRVSPSGDDIYIQFDGATQAVSLRHWLTDTYGIDLVFTPNVQGVP